MLSTVLLAATTPPPDDKVSPGLLGFLVTFALVLATILLMRSMVGHLRKVRYTPDLTAERPDAARPATAGPDAARRAPGAEDAPTEPPAEPRDAR